MKAEELRPAAADIREDATTESFTGYVAPISGTPMAPKTAGAVPEAPCRNPFSPVSTDPFVTEGPAEDAACVQTTERSITGKSADENIDAKSETDTSLAQESTVNVIISPAAVPSADGSSKPVRVYADGKFNPKHSMPSF